MAWLDDIELDRLRRSLAMLAPGHPAAMSRETALALVEELERLRRRHRQLAGAVNALHAVIPRRPGPAQPA